MSEEKNKTSDSVAEQIQSSFLESRKVFLWGEVSDRSARDLTEKLLYLENSNPGKDITFYINSPGGSITAGMAIFDTMQLISSPITVVVIFMFKDEFEVSKLYGMRSSDLIFFISNEIFQNFRLVLGYLQGQLISKQFFFLF